MKHSSQILNLLLATALVVLAIKITLLDAGTIGQPEASAATNSTIETIHKRTSIRSYTTQTVEPEKVQLLLRAAMAAPTAVNKQPWAFIVVDERPLLDSLAAHLPYGKMLAEANLAIVVCGDLTKSLLSTDQAYWVQDCSAATQNILLAATSLGLGAVWTGVFPREERVATVRDLLRIPEHLVPLNVIPIGYPKGEAQPKDKWKSENIHHNRF